jgi:peptidyl-tRNA hydrolase
MDEDDPLVMYLVVRKRTTRSFSELASAAALATRRCAHRFLADDLWRDGFAEWWRDSFRKVCLRAEPGEWEQLRKLDHVRVGDVGCLPPRRRSERERVLARMQAYAGEIGELGSFAPPGPDELVLVVNTSLPMSAGKALAQVGHGALMVDPDEGLRPRIVGSQGDEWERILAAPGALVVRDGGLTEIPRGSATVVAVVP